ncbi:MAG: SAM-dependent methyltransferase [Verrucomicrobia bacterium]|nr:SAM-dependent methyltransferase [Verrucomicrobiota bacterium]
MEFRLIELKGIPHLSRVIHEPKRDVTRNLTLAEGMDWIGQHLATQFRNALLRTTRRDWQLHCPAKGEPRLVGHKPAATALPSREHDTARQSPLGAPAADWLHALGITHANGRPRVSMADKHRQIGRYVEILHHLARDCGWTTEAGTDEPMLKLADMGCGKGYLTFAAWHLFHHTLRRPVSVVGVETREDLVRGANQSARQVNATGLEFIRGEISSAQLPRLDALIALHACNTATDDAIRRGIELDAKLIVVAPCCHQALRPELGNPEPFAGILRHGLFKERLAEWLSDGLRTLFLEWAGYQTKAIEFVGSEHTPKNLMIAAVRKHKPFADAAAQARILALKQFFGIKKHALDSLLQ